MKQQQAEMAAEAEAQAEHEAEEQQRQKRVDAALYEAPIVYGPLPRPVQSNSPINLKEVEASLSSPHYHPNSPTIVCRKCGERFDINHAAEHGTSCLHHA
jgi:hypothetical protein